VFRLYATTHAWRVLHVFTSSPDGADPGDVINQCRITLRHHLEWRSWGCVGNGGCGTVFELDLATKTEKILYTFQCGTDGYSPTLLIYVNDVLYGTAQYALDQA
jgi:uncharacterized repeat protein (TIGR03803 family)